MYDGAITSVRTSGGITSELPITIRSYQGSTLSPYLFVLLMDELTRSIQDEALGCKLSADAISLN